MVETNKRRKNSSGAANKRCAVQNKRLEKMKAEVNDWDKEMNALNVAQKADGDKEEEDWGGGGICSGHSRRSCIGFVVVICGLSR